MGRGGCRNCTGNVRLGGFSGLNQLFSAQLVALIDEIGHIEKAPSMLVHCIGRPGNALPKYSRHPIETAFLVNAYQPGRF